MIWRFAGCIHVSEFSMCRTLFAVLLGVSLASLISARSIADAGCNLPGRLPQPKLYAVDWKNATAASDYYALALSWSPEFCADPLRRRNNEFQCQANHFGFVVHGLWPQSNTAKNKFDHPRHCRPSDLLEEKLLKAHLCTVPSVDLMQNEWAKHGTCAFDQPQSYFDRIEALWNALKKPDLTRILRQQNNAITAGDVRTAFLQANAASGLAANNLVVRVGSGNYLEEVIVCYAKSFSYQTCTLGGTPPGQRIRIRF